MRLGKDALVFTKNENSRSCGFLSQCFLSSIKAETVLVPMVTWDAQFQMTPADQCSRDIILKYSPYKTLPDLMTQFGNIKTQTGTHIVIYNLKEDSEFELKEDPTDIRIQDMTHVLTPNGPSHFQRPRQGQNMLIDIPLDYSLRAYCSVLYLKPRMQIFIRQTKVRTKFIPKSLSHSKIDYYHPHSSNEKVKITFGLNDEKHIYGMMLYHRNRLIKPYVRVGMQLQNSGNGVGVIGVIEADFLQPTHNKQDFDDTKEYRRTIAKLAELLTVYWNEIQNPSPQLQSAEIAQFTWAQCDNCQKWRNLRQFIPPSSLPDKWYCFMNYNDPDRNKCEIGEEQEDEVTLENDLRAARKRQKEEKKRELEKRKLQVEEDKKKQANQEDEQRIKQHIEKQRLLNEQKLRESEVLKQIEELKEREHRLKEEERQLEIRRKKESEQLEMEMWLREESSVISEKRKK